MIGKVKYFTIILRNFFPKLSLVRIVKLVCNVTVLCANDTLHGVCFPTNTFHAEAQNDDGLDLTSCEPQRLDFRPGITQTNQCSYIS